ncbi:MAG: MFS transporter [Anaerolineae bacterium]|nr:MFS transporter [Anaerolineae bacterium]
MLRYLRREFSFMRGNVLVITMTRVLGMFCRSMVFPYASLYILALGGEPEQIGLINSLRPLAGLLVFPLAGYLSDHIGRVKLIVVGGYLSGLIILLFVLAPGWQIVALAGFIKGFMVFQFPPSSALIADSVVPENRGKGNAMMNTISGALAIFSPYIAGWVVDIYGDNRGMRILYTVMMIAYLVAATLNLLYLKETRAPAKNRLKISQLPQVFKNAYLTILPHLSRLPRSLTALFFIILLGFLANAVASPFWVVYVIEKIGLAKTEWGFILLIETLLRVGLYVPVGLVIDKYGRAPFIKLSLFLASVAISILVFATTFKQVLLIRAVMAEANVFFLPACCALMADLIPRPLRGQVMAAVGRGTVLLGASSGGTGGPGMGFLITLPVMLGSLGGGYLYALNSNLTWLFAAGTAVISLLLALFYIRDAPNAHN